MTQSATWEQTSTYMDARRWRVGSLRLPGLQLRAAFAAGVGLGCAESRRLLRQVGRSAGGIFWSRMQPHSASGVHASTFVTELSAYCFDYLCLAHHTDSTPTMTASSKNLGDGQSQLVMFMGCWVHPATCPKTSILLPLKEKLYFTIFQYAMCSNYTHTIKYPLVHYIIIPKTIYSIKGILKG